MGLDVGDKRIGVAVSDPGRSLARSLRVIERGPKGQDLEVIGQLVRELDVACIVVGYPRSLDGTIGQQAKRVERYARELERGLGVPVVLWDERLSTVAAERLMRETGRSQGVSSVEFYRGNKKVRRPLARKGGRRGIDAVAAALILQSYLDYLTNMSSDEG